MLRRGAKAVICYNDMMAMGLMRGLAAMGQRVPDDVSVIGFDNNFAADLVTPGLTTVAAPLSTIGETAIRQVLSMIGGATPRGDVPTVVLVRGSTAPPAC